MQGYCYPNGMTRKNNSSKKRDPKMFIRFLVIAVLLMFVLDFFFWRDGRPYFDQVIENGQSNVSEIAGNLSEPVLVKPEEGEYFAAPENDGVIYEGTNNDAVQLSVDDEYDEDIIDSFFDVMSDDEVESVALIPEIPSFNDDVSPKEEPRQPVITPSEKPKKVIEPDSLKPQSSVTKTGGKIAIVIDDVGMNLRQSRAAIDLPSEVTLAFLPYAEQVKSLAATADSQGHEIIIHAPMEAMSDSVSLGPIALKSDMNYGQFKSEFNKMAQSFDGHVGLNNHMGSKLTQSKEHMAYLMEHLKAKQMYFLDSRTIHTSVAADMAVAYGVPSVKRDVFLDHEESAEYTQNALKNVERIARESGSAVAIGHPKEITMEALRNWIPTLEKKGFELVKVSELLE